LIGDCGTASANRQSVKYRQRIFEQPRGKEHSMATFITTLKFTEQGIKSIGETKKRADAFKAAAKKMGAVRTPLDRPARLPRGFA
jgi:hypothetical protein